MNYRHASLLTLLSVLFLSAADTLPAAGRVVTWAGNGKAAYTGDGGPATSATVARSPVVSSAELSPHSPAPAVAVASAAEQPPPRLASGRW